MLLYINPTLANEVSDEHSWQLGLLDVLRQALPLDLLGLMLNVANKLFRELPIVQSKFGGLAATRAVRSEPVAEPLTVVLRLRVGGHMVWS